MASETAPERRRFVGIVDGLIGVLIFSGTVPATKIAIEALDPVFLTWARAAIAGVIGAAFLFALRQPRPERRDLIPLAIVAATGVIGFPLLAGLSLRYITASHGTVLMGILPIATALFAVLRAGERPLPSFWVFSVAGSLVVIGFALWGAPNPSLIGDLLMLVAVILSGAGHAEGAVLTRRYGGWQVISWALILSLPLTAPLALWSQPPDWAAIPASALAALAYVSLFSMLFGFVFWYRGLVAGGIAAIGQLQLLQPFFSLILAALLLGEALTWPVWAATAAVVVCVAGARRTASR